MRNSLAIDGGTPVRANKLPLTLPFVGEDEAEAAAEAIRSTWISSNGPKTEALESEMAEYLGVKHVILVSNATTAMDLALMALGISDGEIIVPSYTFAATGLAAILRGARPVLADCEFETANIDIARAEQLVTSKTRAIMPVHYSGHSCAMNEVYHLADKHDLFVVEDAAQALGSEYLGLRIGGLEQSHFSCFSFHAIKNVTCGEGGAITTNDDELARRARIMRDKGTDKGSYHRDGKVGFYDYVDIGNNYMLSEILVAVALTQFRKIEEINGLRADVAAQLNDGLRHFEKLALPVVNDYTKTNWHIYQIRVPDGQAQWFSEAMNAEGIQANVHWPPLHMTSLYRRYGYKTGDLPVAERVFGSLVRIPIWPAMTRSDVGDIVAAVEKIHPYL